ncbi:TIGR03032 family protein [Neorhodopirellula pilleata]|uniref:Conserved hypothetical protein CHP03032 domain-containing protein n=1 Tax=Neorhodopirellula pilleata TaxID=2714738 RepID=A0A5C5ZSS5_9BACT|nr:TIGR03032 family protein [Neorhodopirellula pilleata]TWT89273.1 hypothetical protein Pla100_55900 [Neorhodopirellula pilleata]
MDTEFTPPEVPSSHLISSSNAPVAVELRYRCSEQFLPILQHLNASLLVTTYKLGKLAVIQPVLDDASGDLVADVRLTSFESAMGLARHPTQLAVGTRRGIWRLAGQKDLPREIRLTGQDTPPTSSVTFAARDYHITGNISIHEMAFQGDQLWAVNTLFSCLCTFDSPHNFKPRWKPDFISDLAPQDRCHLNGMALGSDGPKYVTALGRTDVGGGWRENKTSGGCVLDVDTNDVVADGLCMPHSPRLHQGNLYLLNSGRGELCCVDPNKGEITTVDRVPGYTRGLTFAGQFAFIGMSQIRESNVFGGLPISSMHESLRCGIAVVDLVSGRAVAWFEFETAVEEIFSVEILPGANPTFIHSPDLEGNDQELWIVPPFA